MAEKKLADLQRSFKTLKEESEIKILMESLLCRVEMAKEKKVLMKKPNFGKLRLSQIRSMKS